MELQEALDNYIQDPADAGNNWNLAQWYEYKKHHASALSYYIRAAERTDDVKFQYESMLRGAGCYYVQNIRNFTVRGMLQHAVALMPKRPEAYWLYSKLLFENKHWDGHAFDSYTAASIALGVCDFDIPEKDPLLTVVDYPGKHAIYWQKAVAAWHCGLCDESRVMLKDLLDNWDLNEEWKKYVTESYTNISNQPHFVSYDKKYREELKHIFPGSEIIETNYSEAYQDMFVLSMLNGKREGTYLEIGAGNSFYGSNTALLETRFDWKGVALDISDDFVAAHAKERKNPCYNKDATTTNYQALLQANEMPNEIDYLQIDCDPPAISLKALMNIPFEEYKFGVITFEHDNYQDQNTLIREKARLYLENYGYILLVDNISPDDNRPYEDWYVHPDLIDETLIEKMKSVNGKTKMAEKYILGKLGF